MTNSDVFKFVRIAAKAADDKLGENIMVFDVRKASSLADSYLLVTGSTHIHIRAIEDAIREELRIAGAQLQRTDGQRGHLWRALDYGSFIVHLMDPKTREFYAMEKLWERGKLVQWSADKPLPVLKKTSKPMKKIVRSPAKKKSSFRKKSAAPKRKQKTSRTPLRKGSKPKPKKRTSKS